MRFDNMEDGEQFQHAKARLIKRKWACRAARRGSVRHKKELYWNELSGEVV